jgi:lambda family phage portal protein
MNWLERMIMFVAPTWGQSRARSRFIARHFEAASIGRRTDGWHRLGTDANAAAGGATLHHLRSQARHLARNNPWAKRGLRKLTGNTIGCGIRPKATGRSASKIMERWKTWAETTECDAAGRHTFYGLQWLVFRTMVQSGEVLIRRRFRLPTDGLSVPLQLQVIEPDFIDTSRDTGSTPLANGGEIIQGIEFDAIGRRVAYWLFDRHPGGLGRLVNPISKRVPAESVLHVYDCERAGQVRGSSWFAPVDLRLHDFRDFEDATLMKAKIAACMAAFVTDLDGTGTALARPGTDKATGQSTDTFEPGMILNLPPGKEVTIANPPTATDHSSYSATALRGVAAGLGTTYEDLSGDYSQLNYSSWRGARLSHQTDIEAWIEHIILPQMCQPSWMWFLTALQLAGENVELLPAEWHAQPFPILDPDKEATANQKFIRTGIKTWAQVVRENGGDPDAQVKEIAKYNGMFDSNEVVLDCDPRHTNGAGAVQADPADAAAEPIGAAAAPPDPGDGGELGDGGDPTEH